MDKDELFELVELDDGTEVLFADCRVDRKDLPEGLYCYDLRGDDEDPGMPATIEEHVMVNHAGCIIAAEPLKFPEGEDFISLGEGLNFLDEAMTIEAFMKRKGVR